MASQTRNATTAVNVTLTGYPWTIFAPFPAGGYAQRSFDMGAPVPVSTDVLELGGFGFAIPAGAPLNSITFHFTVQANPDAAAEGSIFTVVIMPYGGGQDQYPCPGDATQHVVHLSGPGTLWNGAFTPAIINGSTFKVRIQAQWFRVAASLQNVYVIGVPSVTVDYVGSDGMTMLEA